jgi:hypothetical protein
MSAETPVEFAAHAEQVLGAYVLCGSEGVLRLFASAQVEDRLPFFDDRRAAIGLA